VAALRPGDPSSNPSPAQNPHWLTGPRLAHPRAPWGAHGDRPLSDETAPRRPVASAQRPGSWVLQVNARVARTNGRSPSTESRLRGCALTSGTTRRATFLQQRCIACPRGLEAPTAPTGLSRRFPRHPRGHLHAREKRPRDFVGLGERFAPLRAIGTAGARVRPGPPAARCSRRRSTSTPARLPPRRRSPTPEVGAAPTEPRPPSCDLRRRACSQRLPRARRGPAPTTLEGAYLHRLRRLASLEAARHLQSSATCSAVLPFRRGGGAPRRALRYGRGPVRPARLFEDLGHETLVPADGPRRQRLRARGGRSGAGPRGPRKRGPTLPLYQARLQQPAGPGEPTSRSPPATATTGGFPTGARLLVRTGRAEAPSAASSRRPPPLYAGPLGEARGHEAGGRGRGPARTKNSSSITERPRRRPARPAQRDADVAGRRPSAEPWTPSKRDDGPAARSAAARSVSGVCGPGRT